MNKVRSFNWYCCFVFIILMQLHYWLEATEISNLSGFHSLQNLLFYCGILILVLKVLATTKIHLLSYILLAIFMLISLIEAKVSSGLTVVKLILFGLAIKGVKFKDVIKINLGINLVIFTIVVALSLLGVLPFNFISTQSSRYFCLGFKNPNTAALLFFTIIAMFYYLKGESFDFRDGILTLILSIIMFYVTGSRSFIIVVCVLLILTVLFSKFNICLFFINHKWLKMGLYLLFPALTIISYLCATYYNANPIMVKLNLMFSWRFSLWHQYTANYPITFLGNDLLNFNLGTLDNSYLVLLYRYGTIIYLIYFLMFKTVLDKSVKLLNKSMLILTVSYLVYFFVEGYPLYVNANIILLYYFNLFWNRKQIRQ